MCSLTQGTTVKPISFNKDNLLLKVLFFTVKSSVSQPLIQSQATNCKPLFSHSLLSKRRIEPAAKLRGLE